MSDLFHPDVPTAFIRAVWAVMDRCRQHTFQILTKRPDYGFSAWQGALTKYGLPRTG
jgi:protein gp37